jgi:hypothetical protein
MLYVRFPLSLRNVEDLLHERGIDISHETVRFWWNRFGPLFAADTRRKRVRQMGAYSPPVQITISRKVRISVIGAACSETPL